MMLAFESLFPDASFIFQTDKRKYNINDFFVPFDSAKPKNFQLIQVSQNLEWSHLYVLAYQRLFKKSPPSIPIYTRSTRLAWAAAKAKRQCILELHDPLIPIRIKCLRWMIKNGFLQGIVATTNRLKNDLIETLPIDPEFILVFGGAARRDYCETKAQLLSESYPSNIGYAGSAFKGKGLEIVLACAAKMPTAAFHIVGPTRTACEKIRRISPNVILHEYQKGTAVISILKAMDVLLLPNQKSVIIQSGADIGQHTSPLKLFEYMATERPIVASDLPIFNGILKDGKTALLAKADSPDDFCEKINMLLESDDLSAKIAQTAKTNFLSKYTWDHRAKKIKQFLTDRGLIIA